MRVTCKHIATLTLDPKVVLTARGDRPMSLKSLEKDCWRAMRGRSSATTTHVRMQERLIPRVCKTPRWGGGGRRRRLVGSQKHWTSNFTAPPLWSGKAKEPCAVISHTQRKDIPFWKTPRHSSKVITHRLICSFSISFLFCLKLLGFSAIYF